MMIRLFMLPIQLKVYALEHLKLRVKHTKNKQ